MLMLNKIKKVLNIALISSYKNKAGNYLITDKEVVSNKRLIKSIREIFTIQNSTVLRFIDINLNANLMNLIARGLKDNLKILVHFKWCNFTTSSIVRLNNLLQQVPKVELQNMNIQKPEDWIAATFALEFLNTWECKDEEYKQNFVIIWKQNNEFLKANCIQKCLIKKQLTLYLRNIEKFCFLIFTTEMQNIISPKNKEDKNNENFSFFRNICGFREEKYYSAVLHGRGDIRLRNIDENYKYF